MRTIVISLVLLKLLVIGGLSAFFYPSVNFDSQAAGVAVESPTPPQDTISRPTSQPYTGTLDIFEDPQRDKNLSVERVMDVLSIREGKNVADIGAGSGWFTVRAARRVGPKGKIFAVDINQDYVKHIEQRSRTENLPQIQPVLGKADDPMLPVGEVDSVLVLKTYHEISEPVRLMTRLRRSLRKGALVGIIDKNGGGDDHGLDREKVVEEMDRAGFKLKEEHDFVKPDRMDYFLVFEVR